MSGVKGRGGRPRKPVKAHKRDNTYRPSQHGPANHSLDGLDGKAPTMPPTIKKDAVAKKMWTHLSDRLGGVGVISDVDAYELEMLCRYWSLWRKLIAKSDSLNLDSNEAARLERRANHCFVVVERLGGKFGLSPSDRAKLRVAPPESGNNDLAEFGIVG